MEAVILTNGKKSAVILGPGAAASLSLAASASFPRMGEWKGPTAFVPAPTPVSIHTFPKRSSQSSGFKPSQMPTLQFIALAPASPPSSSLKLSTATQHHHLEGPQASSDLTCSKLWSACFTLSLVLSHSSVHPAAQFRNLGSFLTTPTLTPASIQSNSKSRHFFLQIWPPYWSVPSPNPFSTQPPEESL